MTEQTLCFSLIRPAHWDYMTADRSDAYIRKMQAARQAMEVRDMIRQVEELQRCALFRRQALT